MYRQSKLIQSLRIELSQRPKRLFISSSKKEGERKVMTALITKMKSILFMRCPSLDKLSKRTPTSLTNLNHLAALIMVNPNIRSQWLRAANKPSRLTTIRRAQFKLAATSSAHRRRQLSQPTMSESKMICNSGHLQSLISVSQLRILLWRSKIWWTSNGIAWQLRLNSKKMARHRLFPIIRLLFSLRCKLVLLSTPIVAEVIWILQISSDTPSKGINS